MKALAATIASEGWLPYRGDDGTVYQEWRSAAVLRAIARRADGVPVTLGHNAHAIVGRVVRPRFVASRRDQPARVDADLRLDAAGLAAVAGGVGGLSLSSYIVLDITSRGIVQIDAETVHHVALTEDPRDPGARILRPWLATAPAERRRSQPRIDSLPPRLPWWRPNAW